jgi:hypothetical protein
MLLNMEEKFRYYLSNLRLESRDGCLQNFDFSIPISIFEEILKEFTEKYPTITAVKNGHKLYGINNKIFKIFQDGSCYGYIITSNTLEKLEYWEFSQKTQQILNDDFAGFKTYWVEELYEDIVFKCTEEIQIIFSKMTDIPRKYCEYSIYFESKKRPPVSTEHIRFIQSKLKVLDH